MPSTRRTFVLGATVVLSGCVGGRQPSGTPDETPNGSAAGTHTEGPSPSTHELGEPVAVGDLQVRPHGVDVQRSYVTLTHPDFADVVAPGGRQYLFLTVEVIGPSGAVGPVPDAFSIVAGETTTRGWNRGEPDRPYRDGRPYAPDHGAGWIAFELPAPIEAEEVSIELDRGGGEVATWPLPDGVTDRLRAPTPDFEVRDFEAPSTVRPDEPIQVSATVANVGEGAGTFRGSLNQEGDVLYGAAPFSFDLAPGEEREWTDTVTSHRHGPVDGEVTVHLRFRSAGGDADRDVVIRPEETTSG